MAPTTAQLDELVRRVLGVCQPLRIILFGSAARGEMGEDSDLDVLLIVRQGVHRRHTTGEVYRALIGFGLAVDVVVATLSDLENAPSALVYGPALQEGREIYHAAA